MSMTIVLPALGESVSEGTITRWLKQVGDAVEIGEPLVEVSTDKVDTEVMSTSAGVIESLLVQEAETVDIGTAIALVSSGLPGKTVDAPAAAAPVVDQPVASPTVQVTPAVQETVERQPYLSPLVRRLVAYHGLDASTIAGTGAAGRVRRDDVLAAVGALRPEPVAPTAIQGLRGTSAPMSRLRRVLATRAVESMSSTAQLTTVVEVDVTHIDQLRRTHKEAFRRRTGLSLSFLPFFAVAATEALRAFPIINARIESDHIVYPEFENVNIAVDTEGGLYSPVVPNAAELDIEGFARAIDDVAERARAGRLSPDDLSGGTFTITNTGSRGALFDTPVVFLPQVAILGTGMVTRRPVVLRRDGEDVIAVRSMVYLALSYDHRAIDGADAARYLGAMKARLEAAEFALA